MLRREIIKICLLVIFLILIGSIKFNFLEESGYGLSVMNRRID